MRPDGNKFQRRQALPRSKKPHSDSLALLLIGGARPRVEAVHPAAAWAAAAAAAIMGSTYPDLYAVVGVHSGLACGATRRHTFRLRRDAAWGSQPPRGRATNLPREK